MPSSSAAPATEQLALATAARLAHANRENWARCPSMSPPSADASHRCDLARWHDGRCESQLRYHSWRRAPELLPTLAEAKAEWAAAGGDPERGPALSGRSADGRVRWCSNEFGVSVHVGFLIATRRAGSMGWDFGGHGTSACLVELGRLAEAAEGVRDDVRT